MVHSGHGTARLDQVRFGGLAASCGGRGAVRSGLLWFRVVRSVTAVWVRYVRARCVRARLGRAVVFRCALVW
jgi:hypothetical protein